MSDESSDLSDSSDQACNFSNNLDLNGKILGNYNIIHEIGRGGYSIVWLALHIGTQKYFALKVQEPDSFKDGMDEVQFVSTLPTSPPYFNNIIEYFTHINNKKKYLCSVFHLHATNLDSMIRNGGYGDGFGVEISNKIMNQMIGALTILHNNYKVFHGDIKPDNIFLKGTSPRDKKIIELYNSFNFVEKYKKAKLEFWLNKKNSPNSIDKMKIKDKLAIRLQVHQSIINSMNFDMECEDIVITLDNCEVSLGDFGTYCGENNYYDSPFGTRYYQAPEIILGGKCSYQVDIWALGCTYYELLTGNILFDPIKDSHNSRDYYHLALICDTCGELPENFLKSTKTYKQYFDKKYQLKGYSFPQINRLDRKINELSFAPNTLTHIKTNLSKMLSFYNRSFDNF